MLGTYELHTVNGKQGFYNKEDYKNDYDRFCSYDFKELEKFSDQVFALATWPKEELAGDLIKKLRQMIKISFSMFLPGHKPDNKSLKKIFWNTRRLSHQFNVLESYVDQWDGLSNYPALLSSYALSYRVIFEKLSKFFPEEI